MTSNPEQPRVLLIEDERGIADTVVYALTTEGFQPTWCGTGNEGLRSFRAELPDLVILDVGLPDANGFDLCRQMREHAAVPIIFLTARAEEVDRVVGLEIGADDYVVKPFSPRELTARIRAVLRRSASRPSAEPTAFVVEQERYEIRYHGQALSLSRYEYRLLRVLVERPSRVYTREELLQLAWNEPENSFDRTVDTHIKTIRAKLRAVKPDANPIKTHRGIGYSLGPE